MANPDEVWLLRYSFLDRRGRKKTKVQLMSKEFKARVRYRSRSRNQLYFNVELWSSGVRWQQEVEDGG